MRWHWPAGDGDEVWANLQGNYRVERAGSRGLPPLPAVSPESFSWQLASSSPFHLWPLEIIGDALSVNSVFLYIYIFFVRSKLRSIVSGRGPEISASQKNKNFFFLTFSKWTNLSFSVVSDILTPLLLPVIFSAVSCLPFLLFHLPLSSQQSLPPPTLSMCSDYLSKLAIS